MELTSVSVNKLLHTLRYWFDSSMPVRQPVEPAVYRIDWLRAIPFIALHLSIASVLFVGWSPTALAVAIALYGLRMFAITGFYHRYFSHKAFRASRPVQFIFAVIGASAVQRGPLWWAAHHRMHHVNADRHGDEHSPRRHGFFWSHMGWFLSRHNFATRLDKIQDFARYPELRFLDRFDTLVPTLLALVLFIAGELLATHLPDLETNGWQLLVWGFVISTVVLYHVTFTINSLAHSLGHRRFATRDDSRNNWVLALFTFGEGWHNNHHFYPGSARQGFTRWELDLTYYLLRVLEKLRLIHDLRPVPQRVLQQRSPTPLEPNTETPA